MSTVTFKLTAADLAPPKKVPFYEYAKTAIRNIGVTFTRENPLFWSLTSGRHEQADMEGKFPMCTLCSNPGIIFLKFFALQVRIILPVHRVGK